MLKGLLGILVFFFCLVVLILMLTWGFIMKTIRRMRQAAEQAAEERERQHREETGRQSLQYRQRRTTAGASAHASASAQPNGYTTVSGETIIDDRHQQRSDRKIFDDADGEYVDFEEA